MIGRVIAGQYRVVAKLGEGGMGAVYKGIDNVDREVAIKMLRPEIASQPDLVERFRAEAKTLGKLNYPGIAILYNFLNEGTDYFMVMEFVSGQSLDAVLRQYGAMPWDRALRYFCRILESIEPAHQAGILHRDIKPANIMLTPAGGIKVMDFGIARVLGSARMTREGRMVGTIEYIAPERIKGVESDLRADIYSLGVVLYEMLTGHLPFESDSEFEIMRGHVQEPPPPLAKFGPSVPAVIDSVVMKALAKSPTERYQSCADFLMAIQAAIPGIVTARTPSNPDIAKSTRFIESSAPTADYSALPSGNFPAAPGIPAAPSGDYKSTRFDPQPSFVPPVAPGAPPLQPGLVKAGMFDKLTWKHYAGAAAVLVVLLAGAVALALRPAPQKSPIAEPLPAKTVTQPVVSQPRLPAQVDQPLDLKSLPTVDPGQTGGSSAASSTAATTDSKPIGTDTPPPPPRSRTSAENNETSSSNPPPNRGQSELKKKHDAAMKALDEP
jgi:serine/threonine-protein kinase